MSTKKTLDQLIYKSGKNEIIKDVTDCNVEDFLNHCITLMRMLNYSEQHINEALEEATVDEWI